LIEVVDFVKLPIVLEGILKLVKKAMQDEWKFCMGLHLYIMNKDHFSFWNAVADLGTIDF
jgi:hypothetical protein